MTSQGTAHGRFTRAIRTRNLWAAEMALRELGTISLDDALGYLDLLAEQKPERLERAVVRWHGRLETEAPLITMAEAHLALPPPPTPPPAHSAAALAGRGARAAAGRRACAGAAAAPAVAAPAERSVGGGGPRPGAGHPRPPARGGRGAVGGRLPPPRPPPHRTVGAHNPPTTA